MILFFYYNIMVGSYDEAAKPSVSTDSYKRRAKPATNRGEALVTCFFLIKFVEL